MELYTTRKTSLFSKTTSSQLSFTLWLFVLEIGIRVHGLQTPAEYDFVIVGGGAAGCLMAARLSEVSDWSVLLIEAGGEENLFQDVPLFASAQEYTPADWGYRTERSNSSCLGMQFGQCHWPRGRVLGGSTVINYMTCIRGNRADYDGWEALGNKGWGYDDVLPYFLKFENMTIPEYANDTKYHSTKGELVVSHPPYHTELATAFVNANLERGLKYIDYNGASQIGYSYLQSAMKNGWRWSAYHAFIERVRNRKNLHIVTRSLVTKILIDKTTLTAYGVEYLWSSLLTFQAHAKKEVIITAGAINSPQLLMLSGIGPKDHLQEVGIPVIKDSKVGYNLQDHVTLGNLFFTVNQSIGIRVDNPLNDIKGVFDLLVKGTGILTIPGGTEAIGFEDLEAEGDGFPEIELLFAGTTTGSLFIVWNSWGARTDILLESYLPLKFKDAYMVFPLLLRPYSRGRIMLKDKSPFTYPLLYANYFSDQRDIETIIKGIRIAINMTKAKALQKYGADLYRTPLSPCSSHEFDSDAYWDCSIRYMTFSYFHQSGTCKMGPDSDPDAVVDYSLRVKGINNLRVADASIMPRITSGHIMFPVYMIAEKAADMIKKDYM